MAKPTILKERGTGEEMYPHTLASLVQTSTGENVDEAVEKAKFKVFVDMWNQAWGQYGKYDPVNAPDSEHPFMGNEIWMTYKEAVEIYNISIANLNAASVRVQCFFRLHGVRTLLPFRENGIQRSWHQAFFDCIDLETVSCNNGISTFNVQSGVQMFYNCMRLKNVLPRLILENCSSASGMFENCHKLEALDILSINCSISLAQSPLWRLESIRYTVNNRPAYFTKPITITVHPDVYAKLTGDTTNAAAAALTEEELAQWQQVLADAVAKDISFATT